MMTDREIDVKIAELIFKTKVTHLDQKSGWRIDYVGEDERVNKPILAMGMIDGYRLKYFSQNLDDAFRAVNELYPDDQTFRITIDAEVSEGFSGYHAYLDGAHAQGKTIAQAICLAVLQRREHLDAPVVKEEDLYAGKSIFMKKDGEEGFIGIHGTYFKDGPDLHLMEAWINVYDEDKKFKCSASRLFGPIEMAKEDFEKDGYVEVPDFETKK